MKTGRGTGETKDFEMALHKYKTYFQAGIHYIPLDHLVNDYSQQNLSVTGQSTNKTKIKAL